MRSTGNDPVISSYAKALARTITVGGIFQFHEQFAPVAVEFLAEAP